MRGCSGTYVFILAIIIETVSDVCARSRSDPYLVYSLESTCLPHRSKRELKLYTGAAIFYLDESFAHGGSRSLLNSSDLNCHLEFEVPSKRFGFHVYFEELNLDQGSGTNCHDYAQFGRDVLYITTKKSKQFCGKRDRIFFHNATESQKLKAMSQGQRWYLEENDHEMDFWVKIHKNTDPQRGQPGHPGWRKLVIVVTVFKKNCNADRELGWKQCKHSKDCIRNDYFCDARTNCAWPSGEDATDEANCERVYPGRLFGDVSSKTGSSGPNIPLILIVIIVIVFAVVVFAVVITKAYKLFKPEAPRSRTESASQETSPALLAALHQVQREDDTASAPPSANPTYSVSPPSYDEAIKAASSRSGSQNITIPTDDPPPYTEQS